MNAVRQFVSQNRALILIAGLALVLRVIWALAVPVVPISDSAAYDLFARRIAGGLGYTLTNGEPTAYWPVGPSALYGAFYYLFGATGATVVCLNLAMGLALVAAVYYLAASYFGPLVTRLAATIVAIWPLWICFTTVLNSEVPFTLLLILALIVRARCQRTWVSTSATAALIVAACFMRATALPLLVILPVLDLIKTRRFGIFAMQIVASAIVAAMLLTPWVMRNQHALGSPVLISTNFGINLWMGNNPASDGGFMTPPPIQAKGETAQDEYFKTEAVKFIRSNPGRYVALCISRLRLGFDRETTGIYWNSAGVPVSYAGPLKVGSSIFWLCVLCLSIVGVAIYLFGSVVRLFDDLVIVPAFFAAILVLTVGIDRYHMPTMPFVAIFAAVAISKSLRNDSLWSSRIIAENISTRFSSATAQRDSKNAEAALSTRSW